MKLTESYSVKTWLVVLVIPVTRKMFCVLWLAFPGKRERRVYGTTSVIPGTLEVSVHLFGIYPDPTVGLLDRIYWYQSSIFFDSEWEIKIKCRFV